jgi:hypothetical protein
LHRLAASIRLVSLCSALTAAALSEAERIVFAAEGLLLAHEFPFNCGIRAYQSPMRRIRLLFEANFFLNGNFGPSDGSPAETLGQTGFFIKQKMIDNSRGAAI